jgi:hypothetical protein
MPEAQPEPCAPAFSIEKDPPRIGRVARPVWPDRARRVTTPLLRDPIAVAKPATKPQPAPTTTRRHDSKRAAEVAGHEGFHSAAALYYGVRVFEVTILPEGQSDGRTRLQDVGEESPTIAALITLAAQVGDEFVGFPLPPDSYEGDRERVGGTLEWREDHRDVRHARSFMPRLMTRNECWCDVRLTRLSAVPNETPTAETVNSL